MLGIAAGFGGGLYLQKKLGEVSSNLPQFRQAQHGEQAFKLSVRVIAASVPAISEPGFWSNQRPRLELSIGGVQKTTELADFADTAELNAKRGNPVASECSWRFGETLTFAVRDSKAVMGPAGLRLCLRVQDNVALGPLRFDFTHMSDIGEAAVDLTKRVFPACVNLRQMREGVDAWESPVLLIPLVHMRGGIGRAGNDLEQTVAHVALSCSLDVNPELLISQVPPQAAAWQVADDLANRADDVMRWLDAPIDFGGATSPSAQSSTRSRTESSPASPASQPHLINSNVGGYVPASSASNFDHSGLWQISRGDSTCAANGAMQSLPPPPPQVTRTRYEAHPALKEHGALPPPPPLPPSRYQRDPLHAQMRSPSCFAEKGHAPFGSIVSPDLPDEQWVSQQQHHGRTFWHNLALGPAPWEHNGRLEFAKRPAVGGA